MVTLNLDNEYRPDPHSAEIMRYCDGLEPEFRALVHEYGLKIVADMLGDADNPYDPEDLADILQTWRERRQDEWLATDYITKRSARGIADAVARRMAAVKHAEAEIWNAR